MYHRIPDLWSMPTTRPVSLVSRAVYSTLYVRDPVSYSVQPVLLLPVLAVVVVHRQPVPVAVNRPVDPAVPYQPVVVVVHHLLAVVHNSVLDLSLVLPVWRRIDLIPLALMPVVVSALPQQHSMDLYVPVMPRSGLCNRSSPPN
jgi:hypothetical protein